MHRIFVFVFLHVFTNALSLAGEAAAFPERRTRVAGEFTIDYSVGDEVFADAAEAQLSGMKRAVELGSPPKLALADLRARREHFLARAASWLGLAKPTTEMGNVFDRFTELEGRTMKQFKELPERIALWRRPELLARLQAGEKISGFSLGGETGLNFGFTAGTREVDGKPIDTSPREALVYPLKIGRGEGKSPDEEVSSELEAMQSYLSEVSSGMQVTFVFVVLHETVEWGIVNSFIASKDRRWFCDGVANYVAWKLIAEEVSAEEAKSYYNLEEQLARYAPLLPRVDLAKWPAAEDAEKLGYAGDLNTANYAFATKVIADIGAKHGDTLLPKLFREIAKTPQNKTAMKTVYRAFKKLTREEMPSYLPKPAKVKR